jgi:hypothetical protein
MKDEKPDADDVPLDDPLAEKMRRQRSVRHAWAAQPVHGGGRACRTARPACMWRRICMHEVC